MSIAQMVNNHPILIVGLTNKTLHTISTQILNMLDFGNIPVTSVAFTESVSVGRQHKQTSASIGKLIYIYPGRFKRDNTEQGK